MKRDSIKYAFFALMSCLGLGAFCAVYLACTSFSNQVGDTFVYIRQTDNADSVFSKLAASSSPVQMSGLKICAGLVGYSDHVHPGKYGVGNGQNVFQVLRKLRGGQQTPVRLVIPVVHTLGDLSGKMSDLLAMDSLEFLHAALSPDLLKQFSTDSANIMCLFIPNTYEVYWNTTPEKFMQRMKREHDAFWTSGRKQKAENMGLTTNEVYVLASIIQQESSNVQELPMIAGMYLNRLKIHMRLQADPTVKFALQDFSIRRILHQHLTVDSPYNTYQREGLPVGPICIPSLNAIEAVLNYKHHDFLYMCAKEDFSGTHNFATTFKEHQQNAARYARALNERRIFE